MKKTLLSMLLLLLFVAGAKAQIEIPLTFEAIREGTVTLEKVGNFTPNSGVQYRIGETGDWSNYSYGTGISLQSGEKLQFRSTSNDAYAEGDNQYSHFTCTADCYLYGNLCSLFDNNTAELPSYACTKMFYGNTHIKIRSSGWNLVLSAISMGRACYKEMFSGCTALTRAPELRAISLYDYCYQNMFSGCTALTTAPELRATSLRDYCYQNMFSGCTALTSAPELPATRLAVGCYSFMFDGCTHLNYVRCLATDISASGCTSGWLNNVAAIGVLFKAPGMEHWTSGDNIPSGWVVEEHDIDPITVPLTFQAGEAGTITVKKDEGSTLDSIQYSLNGSEWAYVSWNTPISLAANDVICFRGNNGTCCVNVNVDGLWQPIGFHFECSNRCYVHGNMMSLIDQDNFATNTTLTETFAFYCLFRRDDEDPHTILNHPLFDIVLPATTLTANCYNSMFMNCQGITRAPALPATILAEECYSGMFANCTNLATAPILPATTLASKCYSGMFSECESLTVAPELPATELYGNCYSSMFNGCTNLTTAPALPAKTLADHCYYNMFDNCLYLTAAPELPATTLAESCYDRMFYGCMRLTTAPALPATTLAVSCYQGMFNGCSGLTTAPALPATTLAEHCYDRMFRSCTKLPKSPVLPATTLVKSCYYQMFYGCSKLNYVVCLATDISENNCVTNWLSSVAREGTFVKNPNMVGWSHGASGIPDHWDEININQFTTDGNWDVPANWSNNAVPEAGNSVVISANATIPIGYTANVDYIIVDEGKTLTIADGGQLIHNNAGVVATVQKNIAAYTNNDDGWNFIASPVTTPLTAANVSGLIPSGETVYDLYYLDEENTKCVNYKAYAGNADPGFDIAPKKGYLYANSEGTTINFSGPLQPYVEAGITLNLAKEGDGWNLVGNPFTFNAYANKSYYIINGRVLEPVSSYSTSPIVPCTGIVVQATGDNETVKFTKDNPVANSNQGNLNIVVAEQMTTRDGTPTGSATVDKAIVSFNEGDALEKFVFNEGNAKLYIPQGNKDFAIAYAEKQGEMPLNFKAMKNGEYTITIHPEAVELDYLHLIDNMTGNDIDLLASPSYSFNAQTTDYESRFKLVFSNNNEEGPSTGSGTFAFYSNGNIIINGEGTIQVIDIMGRIIVSDGGHTRCVPTTGMAPGVYVLRLINGDNVKTQKIVVR